MVTLLRAGVSSAMWCSQPSTIQPRTPPARARGGLSLEISSVEWPHAYKKRGGLDDDGDGDESSSRIKALTENFIGSRGRIHIATLVYAQNDINENFASFEHAAVALMWNGSGVGKIVKDYRLKKGLSMLGNAWECL